MTEEEFERTLGGTVSSSGFEAFEGKLAVLDTYRFEHELTISSVSEPEQEASSFVISNGTENAVIFPEELVLAPVAAVVAEIVPVSEPALPPLPVEPTSVIISVPELKREPKDRMAWVITSLIFNGIALLGLFFWIIPVSLAGLFGFITGIVALVRKNTPRGLSWFSTVLGGFIALISVIIAVVIATVIGTSINFIHSFK